MIRSGGLRVRALLDRGFPVVVVAVLLIAIAGGWFTYTAYAVPGTHQEQRTIDRWGVTGSFSHRATVAQSAAGTAFQPGEVVENRNVYFTRVMPVLDGDFVLAYEGSNVPLDVRIQRQLVVQSVDVSGGNKTVYWQETRSLGTNRTTISPGQRATVPFSVDVARTTQEAQNVSERLGSPGQIETDVLVTVTATRQTDRTETRTVTFTLPIRTQSTIYRVQGKPQEETFARTRTVVVPNRPGPLRKTGGPVLLVVGLLGLVGLALASSRDAIALSEAERTWLAYRDDRSDFDEWITTIQLPEEALVAPTAEAASLADLVDFAIDTDKGVIEDPERDRFFVFHEGVLYTYRPPRTPAETSADGIQNVGAVAPDSTDLSTDTDGGSDQRSPDDGDST